MHPNPPSPEVPSPPSPTPTWASGLQELLRALLDPWTWRMAARDTRGSRRRLLIHSLSIVAGVSALVAVGSFAKDLEAAIEKQAKGLLGADLVIGSRSPFPPEAEALFREIGGTQSREISFSSMIYFPKEGGSRLVQVRALEGAFPYYGDLDGSPTNAVPGFREGRGLLIEESILAQFGAKTGDLARIGDWSAPVLGALLKVPGETMAFATMAPRVFMDLKKLPETGLLKGGSLARYRVFVKLGDGVDATALVKRLQPRFDALKLNHQTVQQRKEDVGNSMANLYRFLSLSGFVALLLGSVGMASAVHVHVRERLGVVAVLRCLGSRISQTVAIYLAQAAGLGLAGGVAGALIGVLLQQSLPWVASDFLPMRVETGVHGWVAFQAMLTSVATALLFACLPLLPIRFVSPLQVIRMPFEHALSRQHDPAAWVLKGVLLTVVTAFAIRHSEKWYQGLGLAGGLLTTLLILAGVGVGIGKLARRFIPRRAAFVWRQGLANLYRPNNRTVLTLVALGFGTFLVLSLSMVHSNLLRELVTDPGGKRPNMIVFDVQPDQKPGVTEALEKLGAPLLSEAPVVNMRIASVKSIKVDALLADKSRNVPGWVVRREYRSTFRGELVDSEQLTAGQWVGSVDPTAATNSAVPISLEEGIARDLQVGLGDELEFDVQGWPIRTRVSSLRKVDWRRVQANFFVVFPKGVLEEAPTWYILATRASNATESARIQRAVVSAFPTVSMLDLELVLRTMDEIVGKIAFGVRFMALFTIGTGLLVMVGAIWSGRSQRVSECVLLRTLGASRAQILKILFAEYLFLGVFGAATGGALALVASWALALFVFKIAFTFNLIPVLAGVIVVSVLTVAAGLLASLGLTRHPPLAVLRAEQR